MKYCYSSYNFERATYLLKVEIELTFKKRFFKVYTNDSDKARVEDYVLFHTRQFYKRKLKSITTKFIKL